MQWLHEYIHSIVKMTKTSRFLCQFFGVLTNELKKLWDLYILLIFQNFPDMKKFFQRFIQHAYIHCQILGLNKRQNQGFFITFEPFCLFLWAVSLCHFEKWRGKNCTKGFLPCFEMAFYTEYSLKFMHIL